MGDDVVAAIADLVIDVARPVLVAVDGPDGAGKTHFARDLTAELAARGRPVEHSSVDHFHHPREHRHALARNADTVWARSYDYRAMRRDLLDPWRRGPGATYTPIWHDVSAEQYVDPERTTVPERGVLVVDGVFLQRAELVDQWDLTVYLDVPPEVTVQRMSSRDGTTPEPGHPDHQRYLRAQEFYRATCDPIALADVVIDNSDWARPRLVDRLTLDEAWRNDGAEIVREVRLPADAHERARVIDRLTR